MICRTRIQTLTKTAFLGMIKQYSRGSSPRLYNIIKVSMAKRIKPAEEIAHHEAGHAVISYRLRPLPISLAGSVTIVPTESNLGSVKQEWDLEREYKDQIIILLSGFAAEKKYNPRLKSPSYSDMKKAADLWEETSLKFSDLNDETDRIVNQNWKVIKAIAEKLLIHKTIDLDIVGQVIDAIDEGVDWEQAFEATMSGVPYCLLHLMIEKAPWLYKST